MSLFSVLDGCSKTYTNTLLPKILGQDQTAQTRSLILTQSLRKCHRRERITGYGLIKTTDVCMKVQILCLMMRLFFLSVISDEMNKRREFYKDEIQSGEL